MLLRSASLLLFILLAGCATNPRPRPETPLPHSHYFPGIPAIKPVVAVADFDNRSGFRGQWQLGTGMAEVLVSVLMETGHFTLLERQNLDDLLREIDLQQSRYARPEGRLQTGRLKNVRYLFRGVITDFTVTGNASGWFANQDNDTFRLGGSRARVAINLHVYDVESSEIVASVDASASVGEGYFGGSVNYHNVSFGGTAFFRTPLGKATRDAIDEAVAKTVQALSFEARRPRVAEVHDGQPILNGGRTHGVAVGDRFLVRGSDRRILDPDTGDVIQTLPGEIIGKIRVVSVTDLTATAAIEEGEASRGDYLERMGVPNPPPPPDRGADSPREAERQGPSNWSKR